MVSSWQGRGNEFTEKVGQPRLLGILPGCEHNTWQDNDLRSTCWPVSERIDEGCWPIALAL